jgi:hypothetical protein
MGSMSPGYGSPQVCKSMTVEHGGSEIACIDIVSSAYPRLRTLATLDLAGKTDSMNKLSFFHRHSSNSIDHSKLPMIASH